MRETTPEVEAIGRFNITGNVIPNSWFKTIVGDTGKPNVNAIMVLSDIVYWYRPTEVRDERTGATLGFQRKFKGDLLQRSYKQLSDQFGISKQSAMRAVVLLEKLGAVTRVFKTIEADGTVLNNVLFIKPNVERLFELTYPDTPLPSFLMGGCHQKRGDKYIDFPTETSPTCNTPLPLTGMEPERPKNERAREGDAVEDPPKASGEGSGNLDKIIEDAIDVLQAEFPEEGAPYRNERFRRREREIVREKLESLGGEDAVREWVGRAVTAFGTPEFAKWLKDNARGKWVPSLGNVVVSGDWETFSGGSLWL